MPSRERKEQYFARLEALFEKHTQMFIVHADNVGSKQMQMVRIALRGHGEVVMGKNTMMRRCLINWFEKNPESGFGQILPLIKGNIGFVFCSGSLGPAREIILKHVVPAPCKSGVLANIDVWVPAGPTGCDPSQTSYFQALNVATKISKGQIEITNDICVCKAGERVSPGAASLCNKMDIRPFKFGLIIRHVYDNGNIFDPKVLDLSDDDLANKFCSAVRNVAAISLAVGYPTLASMPHSLSNAVMQCVALLAGAKSTYSFEKAELALAALPPMEEPKAEEEAAEEEE
jgi:large subunit ribosomal protein LP0